MIASSIPSKSENCRMSENDVIALKSNFENWKNAVGEIPDEIKPWVYYCVDQCLKPFDLSEEEILYGITDKVLDGGIDAFYFLLSGNLVQDNTEIDTKADRPKKDI